MINYLKAYFEPKSRTLRKMAFESARGYFKGKDKTTVEFQAYQRGYINAYRSTYAKNKLKEGVV
jgi:hypothetical protein